ncbi:MAG TPA: ATP-binding protein, partial [Planctomycetota bacterium]|nr:ATP-binding protein [Planctomycetota bacterium]
EPEMAAEILQPFTSADVAHHGGGSGLSLPLAVLLVERCGGRLSATSAGHGTGATFTVELDSLPEPEAVE